MNDKMRIKSIISQINYDSFMFMRLLHLYEFDWKQLLFMIIVNFAIIRTLSLI